MTPRKEKLAGRSEGDAFAFLRRNRNVAWIGSLVELVLTGLDVLIQGGSLCVLRGFVIRFV